MNIPFRLNAIQQANRDKKKPYKNTFSLFFTAEDGISRLIQIADCKKLGDFILWGDCGEEK